MPVLRTGGMSPSPGEESDREGEASPGMLGEGKVIGLSTTGDLYASGVVVNRGLERGEGYGPPHGGLLRPKVEGGGVERRGVGPDGGVDKDGGG